jgi:integrase
MPHGCNVGRLTAGAPRAMYVARVIERLYVILGAGASNSLRRTFASLLYALGRDPAYVMDQLGHTDPKLALRIYAHAMRRESDEREALSRLVGLEPAVAIPRRGGRLPSGERTSI